MWNYYKRTFLAVQFFTFVVSWMVHRNTSTVWTPTLAFFVSMQVSALFGAMWANRLRKKTQSCAPMTLN